MIQLEASNQFSAIVCSDGNLYLWGNGNMADIKIRSKYQGKIAKVALTDNEYIALLTDGTVAYTGNKDKTSPFAKIPAGLKGKTVVDIAVDEQIRRGHHRGRRGLRLGQRREGRGQRAGA